MKSPCVILCIALLASAPAHAHFAGIKSPAAGMHFSQGEPIIVFADLFDSNDEHGIIVCPPGQTIVNQPGQAGLARCSGGGAPTGWPQMQVLVDGVIQMDSVTGANVVHGAVHFNSQMNPDPINFYRFSVTGLAVGPHELKVRGRFAPPPASNNAVLDSMPIRIHVDPLPSGRVLLELSDDITGAVDWHDMIVVGNGHTVRPNGGAVVITNTLVKGLGTDVTPGISGNAASILISDSVFESTAALDLTTASSAQLSNNEFRANNRLRFESSDPDASPIVTLRGRSAQQKFFQGNRVGAGRVVFSATRNWLIGGDGDGQGNVLIGPRTTMHLVNGTSDMIVRGNYDHHNYQGGWSQGFNLSFTCDSCAGGNGDGILVEHNIFRGGSWPLQDVTGEFRYNLVFGYGHTWLRSAADGTSIHHNVFAPEKGGGNMDQGAWFYGGETNIKLYNNTFDGGGDVVGDFSGPAVAVNGSSRVSSLRNNLFTFSRNQGNGNAGSAQIVGDTNTLTSADYNAFYSPDNSTRDNYRVSGLTEGTTPGFATHDVSGTGATGVRDGQLAATPFAAQRIHPYESVVDEAAVWQRTQSIASILTAFRSRYIPAASSPVIDAGNPADNDSLGRRTDIGAIDMNGHETDRFGKLAPRDTLFEDGFD